MEGSPLPDHTAAPTPCTFRCLETGHTFQLTVPPNAVVVLTQTATCPEHHAPAVRADDRRHAAA